MSKRVVEEFEVALGVDLTDDQRSALESEYAWHAEHGVWRCTAVMSNGRSDIRCERGEEHGGAHRGRFANGASRVWGNQPSQDSENADDPLDGNPYDLDADELAPNGRRDETESHESGYI